MAINILNNLSLDVLSTAIIENNSKLISQTPGIGIKKAELIILNLKETMKGLNFEKIINIDIQNDLIDALKSMGYKNAEIVPAIKKTFENNNKINTLSFSEVITFTLNNI